MGRLKQTLRGDTRVNGRVSPCGLFQAPVDCRRCGLIKVYIRAQLFQLHPPSHVAFTWRHYTVGLNPSAVAVGDFNADQKIDLVVTNNLGKSLSVLLGNGLGSFGAATSLPVGSGPSSVVVGDFNGDQKLDLAVTNGGGNNLSVLFGSGLGSFGAMTNFAVGSNPNSVAMGDFNGDQKLDLAVANIGGTSNLSILINH